MKGESVRAAIHDSDIVNARLAGPLPFAAASLLQPRLKA